MNAANKCILCNNSSVSPLKFTKNYRKLGIRSFIHCSECDLIFVPKQFHLSSIDEAARYTLHNNTLSNQGYVNMFMEKIALIRQYCPEVKSVLDYGCGHEPVLSLLLKKNGLLCDVYDPFFFPKNPESTYDLVISTEVFEHFKDVRTELGKISSLIKSRGFLAIMTSFHGGVDDFKVWWYHSDPTHICFFSMKTFEWISKQFGYKIIYSNQTNFMIFRVS